MLDIRRFLGEAFQAALQDVMGPQAAGIDPLVGAARDPGFGDYQCNVAMSAAKRLGKKPRELAQQLVESVRPLLEGMVETLEVAGPGFINIRLSPEWLGAQLGGFDRGLETVVVDYSCPNVAKEMHVGHLRSTIIGDAICRVLEHRGHRVIRQNHLGDWGTQFGMLCAYIKERGGEVQELSGIEELYRRASALYGQDPEFAARARAEVVALHQGDAGTREAWRQVLEQSRRHYGPIYRRLLVLLTPQDERGESFYNDRLPGVVADLQERFGPGRDPKAGLEVRESDGAICAFHTDEQGNPLFQREGQPIPFIIQKSDGAFLYATTDLAALQYRVQELGADRVIYVTDARQALHFQMLFATARAAGMTRGADGREVRLEHVTFGTVLGSDRKPLKTRAGGTVKLSELLDEAVQRAETLVREKLAESDPEWREAFTDEGIAEIAEAVGIGAVKYADLAQNRQTDYIFSWDKLLALNGNTAPYLMYAYARVRSIARRAQRQCAATGSRCEDVRLQHQAERTLCLTVLQFPEVVAGVASGWKLNLLADYLYGLAGALMKFYENCPVLKPQVSPEVRSSRLALCRATAEVLRQGLGLLGIRAIERM